MTTAWLLQRLQQPLLAAELRPPRGDLSHQDSIDAWIDMHHAFKRLTGGEDKSVVFLTDNAVGVNEEENLHHLSSNVGEIDPARLIPFLTCKHTLEYCQMYSDRAASLGYQALTVLGGDKDVGEPRCVGHAYELRQILRERHPELVLGGWATPPAAPARQVGYTAEERFAADFYLTQVVSHHDLPKVEAFLAERERQGVTLPAVFGVFYYRSARRKTLQRLANFMPVPVDELVAEFKAGASAEEICVRTVRGLQSLGVEQVYVSNLAIRQAPRRMRSLRRTLEQ